MAVGIASREAVFLTIGAPVGIPILSFHQHVNSGIHVAVDGFGWRCTRETKGSGRVNNDLRC